MRDIKKRRSVIETKVQCLNGVVSPVFRTAFHEFSDALNSELSKMMIHVLVSHNRPLLGGHLSKERMIKTLVIRGQRREAVGQLDDLVSISLEAFGLSTFLLLIDLGRRLNLFRDRKNTKNERLH